MAVAWGLQPGVVGCSSGGAALAAPLPILATAGQGCYSLGTVPEGRSGGRVRSGPVHTLHRDSCHGLDLT